MRALPFIDCNNAEVSLNEIVKSSSQRINAKNQHIIKTHHHR
jgi:hypothetical protein